MKTIRFNIFGVVIGVTGTSGQWNAFYLGNEGKRRPADFIVPDEIGEDDICEYLADLFRERATPENNEAVSVVSC